MRYRSAAVTRSKDRLLLVIGDGLPTPCDDPRSLSDPLPLQMMPFVFNDDDPMR